MKLTGVFTHPLRRQIQEGVSIKNTHKDELLNSKAEFHGPSVLRRVFEGREVSCDLCDYKCSSEHGLKKHKQSLHNDRLI